MDLLSILVVIHSGLAVLGVLTILIAFTSFETMVQEVESLAILTTLVVHYGEWSLSINCFKQSSGCVQLQQYHPAHSSNHQVHALSSSQ